MSTAAGDPVANDPAERDAALDADDALTAALAAAQAAFPKIEKGNTATVPGKNGKTGYSYSYADLGDVLAAVRPVLAAHGLAITQPTSIDGGKVILTTVLRHTHGGTLKSIVDLGQSSGNPQQFGGALTYLRRYELTTLLGIAAEEDRDAQDVEPANGSRAAAAPELPAWAAPATSARLGDLGANLIPFLGEERARGFVLKIRASLGTCPSVVVPTVKLFVDELLERQVEDAGAVLAGIGELLEERDAMRAEAERQAQDAAAEAPDVEPEAASSPEGDVVEVEHTLDASAAEGPPAEEPKAEAARPPGTVIVDLDDDAPDDVKRSLLQGHGCICDDPLADPEGGGHSDACPIKGHGIPF